MKIITTKKYMFAIEGQLYEPDNNSIILFEQGIDQTMRRELVSETTLQVAFLEALKHIMPYWHSRTGIHPDIKKMTIFTEKDEKTLQALHNTLDYFKNLDIPITNDADVESLKFKAINKMFDTIHDMPDAWNEDGSMKDEYVRELFGMKDEIFKV